MEFLNLDFLNTGIITIIAACCLFAGVKWLVDWLRTRDEGERKHLIVLFSLLFVMNLVVLWIVTR